MDDYEGVSHKNRSPNPSLSGSRTHVDFDLTEMKYAVSPGHEADEPVVLRPLFFQAAKRNQGVSAIQQPLFSGSQIQIHRLCRRILIEC